MKLTPLQRNALQNLASKKSGAEVDWISIGDARALTEMGFARRGAGGWHITAEGEAKLREQPETPLAEVSQIKAFTPRLWSPKT